jgi:hypothetical protein
MHKGHFTSGAATIDHGDANILFPVEELNGTVLQRRDAELALADSDGEDVVVIAPTSMASSYYLTQHALNAIPIDGLSATVKAQLAGYLDGAIESYDLIQVGKWTNDSPNHSLTEYADT